jgi:hypothetical protein
MNKTLISVVAASAILSILSGCAGLSTQKMFVDSFPEENATKMEKPIDTPAMAAARPSTERLVYGTFYQTPVSEAVRQLSAQVDLKVNENFRPSERYSVSRDVNSTVGEFLRDIKVSTGIDYRIRNGALSIVNKDLVEESISGRKCQVNTSPTVSISIGSPVYPAVILKYFADNYGMSFVYKTKYYDLTGEAGGVLVPAPRISFHYQGCDPKEAFRTFLKANNLVAEESAPNSYNISDSELSTIDIPIYFDYKYTSSSGVGGSTGSAGASGNQLSITESGKTDLAKYIQKYLSAKGKVEVSNRGYVTIEDMPDSVRNAKKLIAKEILKQKPIKLQVSIIRVDLSDKTDIGVDWTAVSSVIPNKLSASVQYATGAAGVTGGGSLVLDNGGLNHVLNAVQKFGKTKVVRDFGVVQAKTGILQSFKAVDQIPYVTTTTTSTNGVSQSNVEAKTAEAGVIINILPVLDASGEMVDLSTDIVVSELVEMVSFNMSTGEFKLPRLATNEVKIPAKLYMDQTIILTGFKTSKKEASREGIPGLIQAKSAGWLFGKEGDSDTVSEFAIVITPSTLEEI